MKHNTWQWCVCKFTSHIIEHILHSCPFYMSGAQKILLYLGFMVCPSNFISFLILQKPFWPHMKQCLIKWDKRVNGSEFLGFANEHISHFSTFFSVAVNNYCTELILVIWKEKTMTLRHWNIFWQTFNNCLLRLISLAKNSLRKSKNYRSPESLRARIIYCCGAMVKVSPGRLITSVLTSATIHSGSPSMSVIWVLSASVLSSDSDAAPPSFSIFTSSQNTEKCHHTGQKYFHRWSWNIFYWCMFP